MDEGERLSPEEWHRIQAAAGLPSDERIGTHADTSGRDAWRNEDAFFESVGVSSGDAQGSADSPSDLDAVGEVMAKRIGAYRIVRRLGTGGMGAVFLAVREEEYHAEVAIKVLKWTSNREMFHRFRGERQILAGLDHPNIARLLDGGTTEEGSPYLVMEYVEGLPLDRYCAEHDLSISARIRLIRQVCGAVDYAHRNLVVHRDLKPSNILVTADGTPKLLDFGIAKLLSADASAGFLETRTGFTPLTPRFASPEQVRGGTITVASDVYSLGILLFELLAGSSPYDLEEVSLSRLLQLVCESPPPKPSEVCVKPEWRRLLAGDLDNVVLMALRKEPERRYSTAGALAQDLERYLENRPVAATDDTFRYRLAKFVKRHRSIVAAVVLAVICLLAGTGLAIWQAGVAERERASAEQRFQQVRQLAGSFLFEFEEAIKDLPGSTPVRELVVKRALSYLDSLAKDATGDEQLQLELAAAYQKVGDIQGNPYLSNLGRTEAALVSYGKARSILEALPRKSEPQALLAKVLDRMGDVRAVGGHLEEALDLQHRALRIRERLAAADPDNLEDLLDVAVNQERLAELWNWKGNASRALELQEKAGRFYDQALERDPTNLRARRAKAVHFLKIGDLHRADDLDAAETDYTSAVEIFDKLAGEQPTSAPMQHDLSASLKALAGAEMATGATDQALRHYQRALSLTRGLVQADPRNNRFRRDLAVSLGSLGMLFDTIERTDEAFVYLVEANQIFTQLAENAQGSGPLRDLALIQATLGDHFDAIWRTSRMGDARSKAQAWYGKSREVWRRIERLGILRQSDQANFDAVNQALEHLRVSSPD
ncbi:MAG: protein kinase [Acidobacteriota bacterium]